MKLNGRPAPTVIHQLWFDWLQELGCIACLMELRRVHTQGEIHHLPEPGSVTGHRWSICLCPWHEHGVVPPYMTMTTARRRRGPSLAREPDAFHAAYGTCEELHEFQCVALAEYLAALPRRGVLRRLRLENYLGKEVST